MSVEAGARLALTLAAARSTQTSAFRIGLVQQAGSGTLRISCDGLALEPADLWFAQDFNYKWEEDDGNPLNLRSGERLILLTQDAQEYYLLAKAVRA